MKRIFNLPLFAIVLLSVAYLTSYNPPAKKANINNAQEDKDKNQSETELLVMKIATTEEWIVYRENQELRIKDNDLQIADLRKVISTSETGHKIDSLFQKIIELQQKNNILRAKIISYETNQTDWVTFKRKVDNDLLELEKEFNNLSAINTLY